MSEQQPQQPPRIPVPKEMEDGQSLCQHAAGLLSDMGKAGDLSMGEPDVHVERAFAIAYAFQKKMDLVMGEAIEAGKLRIKGELAALELAPKPQIVQP